MPIWNLAILMKHSQIIWMLLSIVLMISLTAGCADEIGDNCQYDIDCSPNLDRTCDLEQPGGYCLIIGCTPDSCPGEANCVEFTTPCPIGTDPEACALIKPNRTRAYCLQHCKENNDCRDAYQCLHPDDFSLEGTDDRVALIVDPDSSETRICVPEP